MKGWTTLTAWRRVNDLVVELPFSSVTYHAGSLSLPKAVAVVSTVSINDS